MSLRFSAEDKVIPSRPHVRQQSYTQKFRDAVVSLNGGIACVYCGLTSRNYVHDHDIPFSRGGMPTLWNIRICCFSCNHRKFTLIGQEYLDRNFPGKVLSPVPSRIRWAEPQPDQEPWQHRVTDREKYSNIFHVKDVVKQLYSISNT